MPIHNEVIMRFTMFIVAWSFGIALCAIAESCYTDWKEARERKKYGTGIFTAPPGVKYLNVSAKFGNTFETHECILCKRDPDASYCIPKPKESKS